MISSIKEESRRKTCLADVMLLATYILHLPTLLIFFREEANEIRKRTRNRKIKRYALVGLATLGGGAVLGLTGGLAAPLIGKTMRSQ